MVLEIALTNFFSINEKITLDLQAANIQTKEARALADNTFAVGNERLLKTVAIYGANASGKSNIIKAVKAAVDMILDSHNYNEGDSFGFKPYKFGEKNAPSEFYIRFIIDGIEHEYSFNCTRDEIITESLYYYPKGRRALIFSRDERIAGSKKEKYEFTNVIRRPMDVASNTSRKTLFISRASQMDREKAKEVYRWFNEQLVFSYRGKTSVAIDRFLGDNKDTVLRVLKAADSDIVEFTYKDGELTTFHRRNPALPFDFNTEESEGTKILFKIMLTVMDVVRGNKVMFLDEVETSLHTRLVGYLIGLFHSSKSAQLVFTTHNTHLLDMTRFRKDQIFFVNKRDDGSSDLYSLFDYKDFREKMDLEKAYLQGRFDAVPYINEF
ncbi:ATP/GTP-binding protein [uncultured Duncaniella sp.]|uniref:AAA family ATPase n=1 Tax=uncultured Duncaniella sp. TaxID=2768039 RepID=UPI0025B0A5A7|nr:ATP-binding protein [uncultured Duncaniella sp.]